MSLSKRMMAVGLPAESAKAINGQYATVVAAASSTQVGAAPIAADINLITTSGAGANSCILPVDAVPGDTLTIVANTGIAASALVYPPVGGTINGGSANAAITFAASTAADLYCTGSLTWYSNPKTPS